MMSKLQAKNLKEKYGKSEVVRGISLEINQGECGGWNDLIPEGAKVVPPGKRIMEFSSERYHRQQSKLSANDPARKLVYKPFYPGFLSKDKQRLLF